MHSLHTSFAFKLSENYRCNITPTLYKPHTVGAGPNGFQPFLWHSTWLNCSTLFCCCCFFEVTSVILIRPSNIDKQSQGALLNLVTTVESHVKVKFSWPQDQWTVQKMLSKSYISLYIQSLKQQSTESQESEHTCVVLHMYFKSNFTQSQPWEIWGRD